ncbi:cytochrome ubiquinol oxidase subunit I [Streptomyces megasporus]|uniref:cytochrome ubiquinol oxidase subunit I n=1 Tax=Streptomyces megasporus TaxID=44060 RepID=UPI0004E24FE5|nr:cytochrome ubiquinol oxidase subunit I [Streptomyces megasporus]
MNGSEALDLARWQFALTAAAHFLFVSLTLGLATFVTAVQTWAVLRRRSRQGALYERMVRFWGQLYVVNYAVGIVTGIVMEFQFGLAWSGLGHYAGNVFGASLAMETVVAFFVESTFLGLWIFGWHRFGPRVHCALLWVVTGTAYLSAYWILVANGFLNHPVGHTQTDHGIELADAGAVLTNPSALLAFGHIAGGAAVTAAFFVAGVSAYHLFRCRTTGEDAGGDADDAVLFRRSLRIAAFTAPPALLFTAVFGGLQLSALASFQPMKDAVWKAETAKIARLQADLVERFGPGDHVPPESLTRGAALLMLVAFALMLYLSLGSALLAFFRPAVERFRAWHLLLMAMVPLPYVAMTAGWVFREVGRQPWVVHELLRTEDALTDVSAGAMRVSLTVFGTLFALLLVVNWWLLLRTARRGPRAVTLGRDERVPDGGPSPEPDPVPSY